MSTLHHFNMKVIINDRVRMNTRLLPLDDAVILANSLSRYCVATDSLKIHIDLDYVNTYFDLFKEFEIMQKLYDDLVQLGMSYDFLSDEVKKEFSFEEIQNLRQRVFNVSLLNRV